MEAILTRSVRQLTRVRMMSSSSHKKADFGFKDVDASDKEKLVRSVFSSVASKYDVMNDLMSFGIHRIWKDEFVSMIGLGASAKIDSNYLPRHLDVAGGTGDIAFRSVSTLAKVYRPIIQDKITANEFADVKNRPVVVCDINPEMLAVGKSRAVSQIGAENAKLVSNLLASVWKLNHHTDQLIFLNGRWTLWKATPNIFHLKMSLLICIRLHLGFETLQTRMYVHVIIRGLQGYMLIVKFCL